jgi:hypothetical protein
MYRTLNLTNGYCYKSFFIGEYKNVMSMGSVIAVKQFWGIMATNYKASSFVVGHEKRSVLCIRLYVFTLIAVKISML